MRAALLLLLASVVASTSTDPDLWGHARFGIDMIRDGSVYQADRYSFTSDLPWLNHEWASEIAIGAAFLLGGNVGLFLLKFGVLGGVVLLLNRTLLAEGATSSQGRDLAIALAVIVTIEQAHNVRPQLFSLLFFTCLLACLVLAESNRRILFGLPVLFAVWANFHGGWIVGGGVLVLWTLGLGAGRERDLRAIAVYAAAGAAALAATLANPHGVKLLEFLRSTVGFGRADIVEWQPVYAVSRNILALWLLIAALGTYGAVRSIGTRTAPGRLLVLIALGVASFRVNRLLAFFGLATLFLYGAALTHAIGRRQASPRPARRGAVWVAVAVSVGLIAGAVRILAKQGSCVAVDWGEYALWHLAPDLLVSVDGRRETVYSARLQDEHLRFYFDAPGGASLPGELGADYIWIPKHVPAAARMLRDGWNEVYRGEQSVILTRTPQAATLASPTGAAMSGRRCFPGP